VCACTWACVCVYVLMCALCVCVLVGVGKMMDQVLTIQMQRYAGYTHTRAKHIYTYKHACSYTRTYCMYTPTLKTTLTGTDTGTGKDTSTDIQTNTDHTQTIQIADTYTFFLCLPLSLSMNFFSSCFSLSQRLTDKLV